MRSDFCPYQASRRFSLSYFTNESMLPKSMPPSKGSSCRR
nr:MAG TPA: hypothetical protein [Caudoviricetes sp.]